MPLTHQIVGPFKTSHTLGLSCWAQRSTWYFGLEKSLLIETPCALMISDQNAQECPSLCSG